MDIGPNQYYFALDSTFFEAKLIRPRPGRGQNFGLVTLTSLITALFACDSASFLQISCWSDIMAWNIAKYTG